MILKVKKKKNANKHLIKLSIKVIENICKKINKFTDRSLASKKEFGGLFIMPTFRYTSNCNIWVSLRSIVKQLNNKRTHTHINNNV